MKSSRGNVIPAWASMSLCILRLCLWRHELPLFHGGTVSFSYLVCMAAASLVAQGCCLQLLKLAAAYQGGREKILYMLHSTPACVIQPFVVLLQVEKAPTVVKAGLKKEEAEELKKKLEAGTRSANAELASFKGSLLRRWLFGTLVSELAAVAPPAFGWECLWARGTRSGQLNMCRLIFVLVQLEPR